MDKLQLSQGGLHRLAKVGLHDSIVGCIVGSALGDAVGLYTEFLSGELSAAAYPDRKFVLSPASQATPFRRDTHRGPHRPGEWTDDTDHAMLLLLSCLHTDLKTLDPKDLAARLHTWVQFGFLPLDTLPLGLGRTVGAIVRTKTYLDDPETTIASVIPPTLEPEEPEEEVSEEELAEGEVPAEGEAEGAADEAAEADADAAGEGKTTNSEG